jgi:hypothetical protein
LATALITIDDEGLPKVTCSVCEQVFVWKAEAIFIKPGPIERWWMHAVANHGAELREVKQ